MRKQLLWALAGVLITLPIAGGLIGTKVLQFKTMGEAYANMAMPPETVNMFEVRETLWQPRVSAVGSVIAVQGILIRSEAAGIVRDIQLESGAQTKAGELIVELDSDVEKAQLHEAQVEARLAHRTLTRARELSKTRNISQADLDSANSRVKQTEAQIEYFKTLIDKKSIRTPFSGHLGIRLINVGQFLEVGAPIVSLQTLDPVFVEFSLPQQQVKNIKTGLRIKVSCDTWPGQIFEGQITAFNPDIDATTRNLRIQATLANPEGQLRPGMYVSLQMLLEKTEKVLFIPATSVLYGPYGNSVFVIENDKVRQQFVRLGTTQGDFVAATEGVSAGDRIVSTGVFKLKQGMSVVIDNSLAPEFKLEPTPDNT